MKKKERKKTCGTGAVCEDPLDCCVETFIPLVQNWLALFCLQREPFRVSIGSVKRVKGVLAGKADSLFKSFFGFLHLQYVTYEDHLETLLVSLSWKNIIIIQYCMTMESPMFLVGYRLAGIETIIMSGVDNFFACCAVQFKR